MERRNSNSSRSQLNRKSSIKTTRTTSQKTSSLRSLNSNEGTRMRTASDDTEATRVIKTVSDSGREGNKSRMNKNKRVNEKERKKRKKAKKKKSKIWGVIKKILIALIILAILGGLIVAGIIAGVFLGFFGADFKMTKDDLNIEFSNSEVYDADGNLLCYLNGNEQRKIVSLDKMPEYLPKAYVAIEDERFYDHPGVDIKRTGAATVTYILHRGNSSFGGSTITQQLVKNITDEDEDTAMRKIKEMARAIQIEKEISKDNILELYLNIIFVGGNNINGVALGSEYYFNKDVSTLTLAECAFMAGINNQPNYYNPFSSDNIDSATGALKASKAEEIKNRTKTVLGKMKELGYINSDEDYNAAIAEADAGLPFSQGSLSSGVIYSAHLEAALNEIVEQMMQEKEMSRSMAETKVYGGGYKIYTTEVPAVQKTMEAEVANPKYINNTNRNISGGQNPQTAMVVIEPKTGKVVGCVGQMGTKTTNKELNRATQSKRQIGSAMKPIAVILPAVDLGIVNPAKVYDDVQTSEFTGRPWPKNYYGGFKGKQSVRDAIKISGNVIPVRILNEVTVEKSIEYLNKMGLYPENIGLSLALGGEEFTPLQIAGAYATIANDGEYIEPTFYNKVLDSEGNVVIEPNQKREQVIGRGEAYIVKSITMEPTKSGGTATYAVMNGWDVAAKTGTTDGDTDRWFCEFTNEYAAACWFGFDINKEIRYSGSPSNPAGGICTAVMKNIHAGKTPTRFERPDNIVEVTICRDSGLPPSGSCKNIGKEIFVKGKEPQGTCGSAAISTTVKICKDSGLLAIEGVCPNVEDKTFRSNEITPTEYCTIHKKPEPSQSATPVPSPSASVAPDPSPSESTKPSPSPSTSGDAGGDTGGGGTEPSPSVSPVAKANIKELL